MDPARELDKHGVVLLRGLIPRAVAIESDRRFRANLERLRAVFPDYETNASKNVFPSSLAMAEPGEPTLPERLAAAAKDNLLHARYVTSEEAARLEATVRPILEIMAGYKLAGLDNCYARYESARTGSAYAGNAIHQDGVFQLMGLTAWIALSPCGRDAPALQFIRKKRSALLAPEPGTPFLARSRFWRWEWTRPAYEPGDVVIFDCYTVHGTHIRPGMKQSRTSLDVRFHRA